MWLCEEQEPSNVNVLPTEQRNSLKRERPESHDMLSALGIEMSDVDEFNLSDAERIL